MSYINAKGSPTETTRLLGANQSDANGSTAALLSPSPFEEADMASPRLRPELANRSTSSFRTHAFAAIASRRLSHHPSPSSPTIEVHPHHDSDIAEGEEDDHDVEAGLRSASGVTSSGDRPKVHWLSRTGKGGGVGDEPGVDVRSRRDEESYGHLKGPTHITVVDWTKDPEDEDSNVRIEFPGERLSEWLDGDGKQRSEVKDGQELGVRWIHVDGLNWEVVKLLTLQFGLHPLAVEDALRSANSPRSKLDFYKNHLYLQILVHYMHPTDEVILSEAAEALGGRDMNALMTAVEDDGHSHGFNGSSESVSKGKNKGKAAGLALPEGVEGVFEPSVGASRSQGGSQSPFQKAAHQMTVDELSAKYMVPVRRGILSIFMTRDNTILTFASRACREVLDPIYERLEDEASLLRKAADVSMLAQAFLDVSVDLAIEISQTFEAEILKLEASVLVDPQIETVRHLHVLSSQLIRLRRSLAPLLRVCYVVRDQDIQRTQAASALGQSARALERGHTQRDSGWVAPQSESGQGIGLSRPETPAFQDYSMSPSNHLSVEDAGHGQGHGYGHVNEHGRRHSESRNAPSPVGTINSNVYAKENPAASAGYFSPLTKVYIGDVLDHLELIISSMDQFVASCDHLTDYVFNAMTFQSNEAMERLSIVTVVFLPLTFIASYYGMNFTKFSDLEGSVLYFWKVAGPCTVIFFLIFSYSYIVSGITTLLRKTERTKRNKMVEEQLRESSGMDEKGGKRGRRKSKGRRKSLW